MRVYRCHWIGLDKTYYVQARNKKDAIEIALEAIPMNIVSGPMCSLAILRTLGAWLGLRMYGYKQGEAS